MSEEQRPAVRSGRARQLAALVPHNFRPGQSGNPGGRLRGLSKSVREMVGKNGQLLAKGYWHIAYGTPQQRRQFFGESVRVSAKDRILAMNELRDSGFGKPTPVDPGATTDVRIQVVTGVPSVATVDVITTNRLSVAPAEDAHP